MRAQRMSLGQRTTGRSVVALLVILGLFPVCGAADPVRTEASLLFTGGEVAVRSHGGDWRAAHAGEPLQAGDEVRVGPGAYAELGYDQAHTTVSRLDQEGVAVIAETGPAGVRVRLQQGRLFNLVAPLSAGGHFVVETPEAVASVRGTVFDGVRDVAHHRSEFKVFDLGDETAHAVVVQAMDEAGRPRGAEQVIAEGYKTAVDARGPREVERLNPQEAQDGRDVLERVKEHQETAPRESEQRVQQGPPPGAPPTAPRDVSAFTTAMEPQSVAVLAETLGVKPEELRSKSPQELGELVERRHAAQDAPARGWDEGAARERSTDSLKDASLASPDHAKPSEPSFFPERPEPARDVTERRQETAERRLEARESRQDLKRAVEPSPPPKTRTDDGPEIQHNNE